MGKECGHHGPVPNITSGGFFAVCLDCGWHSIRSGRHSLKEVFEALSLQDSFGGMMNAEGLLFAENEPVIARLIEENRRLRNAVAAIRDEVADIADGLEPLA